MKDKIKICRKKKKQRPISKKLLPAAGFFFFFCTNTKFISVNFLFWHRYVSFYIIKKNENNLSTSHSPRKARPPALAPKPAPPPTSPKPTRPVQAPMPTPETSTPMITTEDEDEEFYKRKSVAEAKRLFSKPMEQLLVPPTKLARPSKPITVLFKPARDESPRWARLPVCQLMICI